MQGVKGRVLPFLAVFFTIILMSSSGARAAEAVPQKPPELYVYDEAQVLSEGTKAGVIQKSGELQQKYGAQVVVYTAHSLPGESFDGRVAYLRSVMEAWDIGGGEDRGLILGLSVFDGDYEAVAGSGLSEEFTSEALKALLDEHLEPDFQAGSYDAGAQKFVEAAVQKADAFLAASPVESQPEGEETQAAVSLAKKDESGMGPLLWVLLVLGAIVLVCVAVFFISGASSRKRAVHRHNPVITPSRTTVTRLQETRPAVQIKAGDRSTGVYRDRRPR